jgi:ABC transporter substrate binding protein (PQQ-dependent alcohol dehydrogenase system)
VAEPTGSGAVEIEILYIERQQPRPATLSNLDAPPGDEGLQGARLGIADNTTTGRFLNQTYRLREVIVPAGGDFLAAAKRALGQQPTPFIVANLPADDLLALADLAEAKDALIFNAGAQDTRLRDAECRANVLHTVPSRAMLADSLMQFLIKKQWTDILLIEGPRPEDQLFAQAIRNSARKFRTRIVADKKWTFGPDMRRNASAEVPLFTQADDYDVVVVADEVGDFGQYLLYNTWLPRPVAGTHGLMPVGWHRVVEQWGAVQLQNRFHELAKRDMGARDYAVWAGVRAVGEAAARTNSGEPEQIAAYVRSPELKLALFKGRALDFRPWSGQLRQPMPLVHRGAVVALAPFEGFLHQKSDLDTIGIDQPESKCQPN